jgi:hypothetical protein
LELLFSRSVNSLEDFLPNNFLLLTLSPEKSDIKNLDLIPLVTKYLPNKSAQWPTPPIFGGKVGEI